MFLFRREKHLCPSLTVDERTQYGGQAVVEGVMMRSPALLSPSPAAACPMVKSSLKLEPVEKHVGAFQWLNKPFLRGSLALVDAMALGIKALTYAANVQATDEFAKSEAASPAAAANIAMGGRHCQRRRNRPDGTINGIAIGATTVLSLFLGYRPVLDFCRHWLTDKLAARIMAV